MWSLRDRRKRGAVAVLMAATAVCLMWSEPAWAKPILTLSKASGLADGDRITVNGSGFTPGLTQIAIGQCIAEVAGPTDCNLSGGAQFVNADSSGKIPAVTLKLSAKFGSFDCTKRQCVIAAQVLPSSGNEEAIKANKVSVGISFGSASTGGTGGTSLPRTGPGDEYWVVILAGTALLLPGLGFLLLLPRRRRARASA